MCEQGMIGQRPKDRYLSKSAQISPLATHSFLTYWQTTTNISHPATANIAQHITLSHNPDSRNAKRLPARHPKFQLHIPLVATSLHLGRGLHLALFLDYELCVQGVSSGVICACSASRIRSVRGGFRLRQAIVVTREWTLISKARGMAEVVEKLVDLQAILWDKLHHNIPFSPQPYNPNAIRNVLAGFRHRFEVFKVNDVGYGKKRG